MPNSIQTKMTFHLLHWFKSYWEWSHSQYISPLNKNLPMTSQECMMLRVLMGLLYLYILCRIQTSKIWGQLYSDTSPLQSKLIFPAYSVSASLCHSIASWEINSLSLIPIITQSTSPFLQSSVIDTWNEFLRTN